MIRHANKGDVLLIQAVLNEPSKWGKLEAYTDGVVQAAIDDPSMPFFVWEEDKQWSGFCWLRRTAEAVKIEEFGIGELGRGIGPRFFTTILERVLTEEFKLSLWLAVASDIVEAMRFSKRFGFVGADLRKAV